MPTPVPIQNTAGRAGSIGAQARSMRESSLVRLTALLSDGRAIDDVARIQAAREILRSPRHVVTKAQVQRALAVVQKLIEDESTADAALVEAHRLVSEVAMRGRRAGKPPRSKGGAQ